MPTPETWRPSWWRPDLSDPTLRERYAGRHVVIAGTGASAQGTLVAMGNLAAEHPSKELALTGYEQVRSIVTALTGDTEAAERVELVLPESGVCGGTGLFDEPVDEPADTNGCCGPAEPQLVDISPATV